jgi:glycosyltransferase involved in cell wall biosynthesis
LTVPRRHIVHVAYAPFPQDPRVRREALVAAELAQTTVICLGDGNAPGRDRWKEIDVIRVAGAKRRGTIAQYVSEYFGFGWAVHQLIASDPSLRSASVIHVHSLPDFLVFAARPARRKGARIILDLHEIFPEFARAKFGPVGGRLAKPVIQLLERASRRFADVTLTVTRPILELLNHRRAKAAERIEIIHNVPDLRDFGPQRSPQPVSLGGALHLVYHGTLTHMYGLDLAIDGVLAARHAGANVTFDIFGDGPQRDALAMQIEQSGAGDVITLRGVVPASELRERLPTYDAGLVPTRSDEMTQYSLSTKLLEYVHLGLPVLAPALRTYQDDFPDPCLLYYRPNDSEALGHAILQLAASSRDTRATQVRHAQEALSSLTWETERQRLRGIYQELLEAPVPGGA